MGSEEGVTGCGYKRATGFPTGSVVKNPPAVQEMQAPFLGGEDPLEKEMATHPNILAWEIPWTEEPGGLHPWDHKESDVTEHAHTGFV